jgi:hypothetical protein
MSCKYCGAKQTNQGYLKHYGKYTGFECRTYYGNNIRHRSDACIKEEIIQTTMKRLISSGGLYAIHSD